MTDEVSEHLLDAGSWPFEADAVIKDIKSHVNNIETSKSLQNTNFLIYLNVTTKENVEYCVEMSGLGFRVIGDKHDTINFSQNEEWFETPYSLLNKISPLFHNSFGNELIRRLCLEVQKNG